MINNEKQYDWKPERCIQEFYSQIMFIGHYEFFHNNHEYLIVEDKIEGKDVFVVYDRDLNIPDFKEKDDWDIEPKTIYTSLPELCFSFRLRCDGRTIAEYICDFNGLPRIMFPEPVDKNSRTKIWRH